MLNSASALLLLSQGAFALVAHGKLPPTYSMSSFIGMATDLPDLDRDGGGGGTVNGVNAMFFCDTSLPLPDNKIAGWQTNSYAFIENPKDPLQQTNFGKPAGDGYTIPDAAVNWTAAESAHWQSLTLWGNGALVTKQNDPNATSGYLVSSVSSRDPDGTYPGLYNTLVKVTATKSGGLVSDRVVDELFKAPGISWGGYTLAADPSNDYLYLLGVSGADLYVARVHWATAANVDTYEYYSENNNWSTNSSSPAAIFTLDPGPQLMYGNVFWSPFYQTWMSIFMTDWQNEMFMTYSTSGKVEGPYVKSIFVYETCPTMPEVDCHNYAGNAYPYFRGADASEVLLSWTAMTNGMRQTQMGLITFS